jgi:hypothetical protein
MFPTLILKNLLPSETDEKISCWIAVLLDNCVMDDVMIAVWVEPARLA